MIPTSSKQIYVAESDDDDVLLLEQVQQIEAKLNTPARNLKKIESLTLDSNKKQKEVSEVKNEKVCVQNLFAADSDDDDDNDLLENLALMEGTKNVVETTSDCEDEDQTNSENLKYVELLKKFWGYSSFRKLQLRIIKNTIEDKRDQLIVMATGRGKSLCYQFPALYSKGLTIVISPLISLMEDQVAALKILKVKACLFGTSITKTEKDECMEKALQGEYSVIYMTPELIEIDSDFILLIDEQIGINLVAIDECHCVSQWGNDFRPAYRKLGKLRLGLKSTPFMALTATATSEVRKDILKSLHLKNPITTVTSFDRPNLYISASMKQANLLKDFRMFMIEDPEVTEKVQYKFDGPTIIYCQSKANTIEITKDLKNIGIKAEAYNAGLKMEVRKKAQSDFLNDTIDVIVATVAFGMGIDKPDIRNVLHYGAPKELESYYQEIGRAGRDGLPSKCHVFYANADYNFVRFFINEMKSAEVRDFKEKMLVRIQKFLSSTSICRRKLLLEHFQDDKSEKMFEKEPFRKNCCDICTKVLENKDFVQPVAKDFTKEALNFISSIKIMNQYQPLGTVISFLIGSRNAKMEKKLKDFQFKSEFFGSGKGKNEHWWKAFAQQLTIEEYVVSQAVATSYMKYSVLKLTPKSEKFLLNKNRSFKIFESPEMKNFNRTSYVSSNSGSGSSKTSSLTFDIRTLPTIIPFIPVNQITCTSQTSQTEASQPKEKGKNIETEVYKLLMTTRINLAEEFCTSAHNICTNKVLSVLALIKPSNKENLIKISDFPYAKIDDIGVRFIEQINKYCKIHNVPMNNFDIKTNKPTQANFQAPIVKPSNDKVEALLDELKPSVQKAYKLFELEHKDVDDVAAELGIAFGTVTTYLEEAILYGLPINFTRLGVTMEVIDKLEQHIREPPVNSNIAVKKVLKEKVPDMSWDHFKIALALIRRKYGLCKDDLEIKSTDSELKKFQFKQSVLKIENKEKENDEMKVESNDNLTKSRQLPNWLKRTPSEHDIKNNVISENSKSTEINKNKKKPKINL